MRVVDAVWLGTVPYGEGLALQDDLHRRRAAGEVGDVLLQLEHTHVFTVGRRGSREDILWDAETLRARGVEVYETDRGGMVTYHGPGQLVGYPILDLGAGADLVRYLRDLEEALIRTLRRFGVEGGRVPGAAGVWVGDRKVAAVGVRVSRGITKHGFALNLSCDLGFFAGIVPCGIRGKGVTSVLELTGSAPAVEEAAAAFETSFAEVFGCQVRRVVRV